jgi:hypothetical protein
MNLQNTLIVSVAAVAVALAQTASNFPAVGADMSRLTAHVKTLSGNEFEGRAPATAGETKTVGYIASQFASIGVKPGGDPDGAGGKRWTQDVVLVESEIVGPVDATIRAGSRTHSLRQGEDIAIRSTLLPVDRVSVKDAPLIFGRSAGIRKIDLTIDNSMS